MALSVQKMEFSGKDFQEYFKIVLPLFNYRTRANNGRSRLVAAPLSSQAKMHFLLAFYVTI